MRFIKSGNDDSNQYFYTVLLQLIFFGMPGIIYQSRMQREALCGDPEDLKGIYIEWDIEPVVYYCGNGTCTASTDKTPGDSTDDAISMTEASFYLKIFYFWIGLVLSIPFLLVATQLEKRKTKILSPFLEFAIRAVYFVLQAVVKVVICFFLLLVLTCAHFSLLFTIHYLINGTLGEHLIQLHDFIFKVAFIESGFPHDEIDCSTETTQNQWIPSATIYSSIVLLINWIPILSFVAWKFSWILSAETIREKMGVLLYWFALRPAVLTIGTWCSAYFGFTAPVSGIVVSYDLGFFMGWIYAEKMLKVNYPKLRKTANKSYFLRRNESLPVSPVLLV